MCFFLETRVVGFSFDCSLKVFLHAKNVLIFVLEFISIQRWSKNAQLGSGQPIMVAIQVFQWNTVMQLARYVLGRCLEERQRCMFCTDCWRFFFKFERKSPLSYVHQFVPNYTYSFRIETAPDVWSSHQPSWFKVFYVKNYFSLTP